MSLIINTPYVCPAQHWVDAPGGKLAIKPERRPASYEVFDARNNTKRTEVLALVNTIRARVDARREAGWPGGDIVTRKLLEPWAGRGGGERPFCVAARAGGDPGDRAPAGGVHRAAGVSGHPPHRLVGRFVGERRDRWTGHQGIDRAHAASVHSLHNIVNVDYHQCRCR